MDFRLTEEQIMFRQAVVEFVRREIEPFAQEWDQTGEYPLHLFRRLGELGWLGVHLPTEYGGAGMGYVALAILFEELGRASAGVTMGLYCHAVLALTPIALFGNEVQKERYLGPGIKGERIGAFGMTEASAGSDLAAIRTRAVRDGEGYLLNGSKLFCTNSPFSDFVVLSAFTTPDQGIKGISLFILDRGTPGFSVGRRIPMVGMRPGQTAEVVLQDCRVPATALLGEENVGFYRALQSLTLGRIVGAAFATGLARAAFEASLAYAKERQQFGQPIGRFQAIQHKLADMDTAIQAARLLTYKAAWLADQGEPHIKEASQAKLHASETCTRITEQALQIHGAYGYVMESPVQRFYRDTKVLEIGEGTSEILRNVIAHQLGL
ncbi:MAG: acyl-CoA dehydrogenase family protein [Armatimonadota bacterium]|nr:acyl-CoA dehydrogenase family protein [Armatimonadota bacterium]MDR7469506.1 acyl-CoA dehydrogenase family protein [Armatimonadota bacterium]MDR7475457.1 acyl-CoA dehydrogenase family protein [Armatimonadota bacterium]